jgi:PTS system glucitol/sorbitol-specific IIA component
MNRIKYETTVVKSGPLAQEFIASGILVFFGMNAPEELAEFSILHEHTQLHQDVVAGDLLFIDDASYEVLAVGEVANQNLSNLGHLVVKFNGQTEPEMPGDISVPKIKELPKFKPGTKVRIIASK